MRSTSSVVQGQPLPTANRAAKAPPTVDLHGRANARRPGRPRGALPSAAAEQLPSGPDGGAERSWQVEEQDLPARIWRAMQRTMAFTSGAFSGLDGNDRRLLCELLRAVQQARPGAPFSIRRTNLEVRLGISPATASRWLSRLCAQGWITREQQLSRARGFQVATMQLTEDAIQALGLRQAVSLFLRESPMSHPEESSEQSSSKRQSASAGAHEEQASNVDWGLGIAPETPTRMATVVQVRQGQPSIPEPLQPLLGVLSAVQVCFLMRRARAAGHRLEDVALPCLRSIKASNRPLPYVLRLLRLPRDWAGMRARMAAQQVSADHPHPIALTERREGEERAEHRLRVRRAEAQEVRKLKADVLTRLVGKQFAPRGAPAAGQTEVYWQVHHSGIERIWRDGSSVRRATERESLAFLRSFESMVEEVSAAEAAFLFDGVIGGVSPLTPADLGRTAVSRERAVADMQTVRQQLLARRFSS